MKSGGEEPDRFQRRTIVLIGVNITHSRSPYLHNHLFERFDLPYHYQIELVAEEELPTLLHRMKSGGYRGANVTSPYKQRVMPLLDQLSPEAERICAVNTIVIESGHAIGYNTDIDGFARATASLLPTYAGWNGAILGTGGAALAAADALLRNPDLHSLVFYSRSPEKHDDILARWNDRRISIESYSSFEPADFVVHATPCGLPGRDGSVLTLSQLEGSGMLYEMIYSPARTELMRLAEEAGVATVGGTAMFVSQALRSFELWTGCEAAESDLPGDLFEV